MRSTLRFIGEDADYKSRALFGAAQHALPYNWKKWEMISFRVVLLLWLVLVAAGCAGLGPSGDSFQVEGNVYVTVNCVGSDCTGTTLVANATVSTSVDGQTAVTDASGHFNLTSKATPDDCADYTIMITAAGFPPFSGTGKWGIHARHQLFGLSPGFPPHGTNRTC